MSRLFSVNLMRALWSIGLLHTATAQDTSGIVSVRKIWNAGRHNAFTDLTRFDGKWFCTFREAEAHVGGNGQIRVLTSSDGEEWASATLMSEEGIDLRDPKFSITPDNRLMLVMGGSVYEGKTLKERQPRVAFSRDGRDWTAPRRVLDPGEWLWRVTWQKGRAYGVSYDSGPPAVIGAKAAPDWTVKLFVSDDGIQYRLVTKLDVPGRPNEATLRFTSNGDSVALLRREGPGEDTAAWIGKSVAPYEKWEWQSAGLQIGGPNFVVLPNGSMFASGRKYDPGPGGSKTFVGRMSLRGIEPEWILPSGGDCSYPGMVWHDGLLWISYYSSHEGKSEIYLAKVRLPERSP